MLDSSQLNSPKLSSPKNRKVAAVLAFAGVMPLALPGTPAVHLVGLHKFYLGQWQWGCFYLALAWTPMPWIAGVVEGIWYLTQESEEFDHNFNPAADDWNGPPATMAFGATLETRRGWSEPFSPAVNPVIAVTDAVRELDQLRQDGLISEYEFEQKRRRLLDRIG
jgi:TM2 domain-containing membrane protein YozV